MVSNQVLQKTIDGLFKITRVGLAVIDPEGGVLASAGMDPVRYAEPARNFSKSEAEMQVAYGSQFVKIFEESHLEYILVAEGETDQASMVSRVAAFQINELMVAYRERFDKDNFIFLTLPLMLNFAFLCNIRTIHNVIVVCVRNEDCF